MPSLAQTKCLFFTTQCRSRGHIVIVYTSEEVHSVNEDACRSAKDNRLTGKRLSKEERGEFNANVMITQEAIHLRTFDLFCVTWKQVFITHKELRYFIYIYIYLPLPLPPP